MVSKINHQIIKRGANLGYFSTSINIMYLNILKKKITKTSQPIVGKIVSSCGFFS